MGYAHSPEFIAMYDKIRPMIKPEDRQEVAQAIYDTACDLDTDDWDGDSNLERDADVNQEEDLD